MSALDYADYLFFSYLVSDEFDQQFGSEWRIDEDVSALFRQISQHVFKVRGYDVGKNFYKLADDNIAYLLENRGISMLGDEYTGTYLKLNVAKKNQIANDFLSGQDVAQRIKALGADALSRALSRLAEKNGWSELDRDGDSAATDGTDKFSAPASDRIVTFSDNQIVEIGNQTSEIIDAVVAQNQIDGEPGLREVIVGQLKAGRELVRAGSFRLYLVHLTLIETLRFLAARYEREAIGGLASALIVALLKNIGID